MGERAGESPVGRMLQKLSFPCAHFRVFLSLFVVRFGAFVSAQNRHFPSLFIFSVWFVDFNLPVVVVVVNRIVAVVVFGGTCVCLCAFSVHTSRPNNFARTKHST